MAESKASIYPPSNFFGSPPDENEDPYNRRVVRKLNDISFSDDSDPEEIANLKRMPKTVMNEENLKEVLGTETLGLNLENHYWLKNNIISKIGKMAPNLTFLSLRRMKFISNPVFAEIFHYLTQLQKVDLSDCDGLLTSACNLMIDQNKYLTHIQLSGCSKAVDDEVMGNIAKLDTTLVFLDISYAKNVTDEGLKHFEGKTFPCFNSLSINGVTGITSIGLKGWLKSFSETLLDLEAALCDQDEMKAEFFETLGQCYNLESLDLTGCYAIDDMMQMNFEKATVRINDQDTKPGW